jgi:hypothetical protein
MKYRKHLHMRMTTHDQFSDDIRAHPRDMTNIERIHKNMQIPSMAEKGSGSEVAVADLDKKHPNKPEPPSSFKEVLSDQRIGSVVTTKVMNGSSQLYWSLRLHPLMAHTPRSTVVRASANVADDDLTAGNSFSLTMMSMGPIHLIA